MLKKAVGLYLEDDSTSGPAPCISDLATGVHERVAVSWPDVCYLGPRRRFAAASAGG